MQLYLFDQIYSYVSKDKQQDRIIADLSGVEDSKASRKKDFEESFFLRYLKIVACASAALGAFVLLKKGYQRMKPVSFSQKSPLKESFSKDKLAGDLATEALRLQEDALSVEASGQNVTNSYASSLYNTISDLEKKLLLMIEGMDEKAQSVKQKGLDHFLERYQLPDSASDEQRELARAEFFSKIAYQEFEDGVSIQYPGFDAKTSTAKLLGQVCENGFRAYLFADGKDLYLSFRGTKGLDSVLRDLEEYSPGSQSFGQFMPKVFKILEQALDQVLEDKEDIQLSLTGHSLGGCEAQNAAIEIFQAFQEGALQKLNKLKLYHFNAPAISLSQELKIQKLASQKTLSVEVHHMKKAHDFIQNFGQVFAFSKNLDSVSSYKIHFFKQSSKDQFFRLAEFFTKPKKALVDFFKLHSQSLFSKDRLAAALEENSLQVFECQLGKNPSNEFTHQINYILEPYFIGFQMFKKHLYDYLSAKFLNPVLK